MSSATPSRLATYVVGLAATASLVTGCGQSARPAPPVIDAAVQQQLRHDVHAVAAALADHRLAQAKSGLNALNADLAAARAAGKISDDRLARIRAASTRLATDLDRLTRVPPPTVTVTHTASPAPSKDDGGSDKNGGDKKDDGGDKKDDEGGGNGNEGNGGKQG